MKGILKLITSQTLQFSQLTGSDHVLTWFLDKVLKKKCVRENQWFSVPISRIMLRCIYGCQKWIPDKILHRNDNPIFFSTFIFSLRKIVLKMKKKYFRFFSSKFPKFPKISKGNSKFPFGKISIFLLKFLIFPENIFSFFHFQIYFFQRKNKSWEKNWIIISM